MGYTTLAQDGVAPAPAPAETHAEAPFHPHLLVISLGNPPPHRDSLHSAGHIVLQAIQRQLQSDGQPAFTSERIAKKASQVSRGSRYTLMQCPTLMNVSGPWVAKAWREAVAEAKEQHPDRALGLVVVHDDLESDMGVVKLRKWERSHRGHNGLKSIMGSLQQNEFKESKWAKISVGIGRPEGRDHDTVSDYVLKPLSKYQKDALAEKSVSLVLNALNDIEAVWKHERETGAVPKEPGLKFAKWKAKKEGRLNEI